MKENGIRRLLGYTFRYKWSFFISVIGFISFAFADIAAVEWIRRIIGFINSEEEDFNSLLALSLIFIAHGRGIGFFVGNYFMSKVGFGIVHDLRAININDNASNELKSSSSEFINPMILLIHSTAAISAKAKLINPLSPSLS
jgi:ABC-type multidrug transport system fused ATPase/permease subunit